MNTTSNLLTAFGESRPLDDWLRDPRCVVSLMTLRQRLAWGMTPEDALSRHAVNTQLLTAFGEAKTLRDWLRDPRCVVVELTLRKRLARSMTPEKALTLPPLPVNTPLLTAFGEAKPLAHWSRDPRCIVSEPTLRLRLAQGMTLEEALTRPRRLPANTQFLTAFGETKPFTQWLRDSRCIVSDPTLRKRLAQGMTPEEALTLPRKLPHNTQLLTAFGETKPLTHWLRDPRCAMAYRTLRRRVAQGMTPEEAFILYQKPTNTCFLTAFGETKRLTHWLRDPRCIVSATTLRRRVEQGLTPEEALTFPKRPPPNRQLFTAFGETKSLKQWPATPGAPSPTTCSRPDSPLDGPPKTPSPPPAPPHKAPLPTIHHSPITQRGAAPRPDAIHTPAY